MSNERKVYFLAPTWDYAPSGGPIQLGNIITSPDKPADPLNTHRHPRPSEDSLYTPTQKHTVTWDKKKHQAGKFGIWTKFLSVFSLNFGISGESGDDNVYQFERMETEEFMPTEEYLREQMAAPLVVKYLETGQHVYMVTAVKAVYGANAKSAKNNKLEGQANASVDGTPVVLELEADKQKGEGVSFQKSSPFVFAFRLRKVIVHENNDMSTEEYTKRAMYDADNVGADEAMPFIAERVANSDATAEDFDLDDGEEVIDDENGECICVVPWI